MWCKAGSYTCYATAANHRRFPSDRLSHTYFLPPHSFFLFSRIMSGPYLEPMETQKGFKLHCSFGWSACPYRVLTGTGGSGQFKVM